MLWEDPPVRKARKGFRNARLQLDVKGSQQQLVDAVSTLSLTGLGWADGSKAMYDTAKAVVGTERRKARYWVYDNVGVVDQIIAVRKAVGNTKEAYDKARRDFTALTVLAVYRELQKMETLRWFISCLGRSVDPFHP